jgi:hypothetical protein
MPESNPDGRATAGNGVVRVTQDDIVEANRLSLSCPICADAVERTADQAGLEPVFCGKCQTLYHRTCWMQNGSRCAVLGCDHREAHAYGVEMGPRLKISYSDISRHPPQPQPSPNGRTRQLKEQEKRRQREAAARDFWSGLFQRIRQALGL